jgi:hypothetical protein
MTSFKTVCQCFPKFNANGTLLILTFAAFQLFARGSAALPVVTGSVHYASRFGPHSSPGRIPVGDKVLVAANIDSSDPIGSPTISVEAVQGGTTLTLERLTPNNQSTQYTKNIDLDPALTGFWEIIPTDSTGTGPSSFTNAIAEPEFLPLVEGSTVQGTSLGARVSWMLPNLDGFDVDEARVRFYEATSGLSVWTSDALPVQTTSFQVPAGVLQAGVDYVSVILLGDFEGSYVENASWTFSEPFHYTDVTASGDFNLDGSVNAGDYVVWRKGLGTTYDQNDYGVWRANFGASLGPGSGSALPSAEPLSAAVPEPGAMGLAALGAAAIARFCRRRRP